MSQPLYDLDLKRVTRENYITGKAAVNFPRPGVSTGGWHYLSYWDRDAGVAKVSLAGIHYPATWEMFGDEGVSNATEMLSARGWHTDQHIWMANHFRATADMVIRWALSDTQRCNVEIDDWFPVGEDKLRFLDLLSAACTRLQELGRLEKVERWLSAQGRD